MTDISDIARPTASQLGSAPPPALQSLRTWLIWNYGPTRPDGKRPKVPSYTDGRRRGGEMGSLADRAAMVTYDEARDAMRRHGATGVGLALFPNHQIVALDFDNCVHDGKIDPRVADLVSGTYAEFSPSGNGIRAFMRGSLASKKDNVKGRVEGFDVEVFGDSGFVTFTGNVTEVCAFAGFDDVVADLTPAVLDLYRQRFGASADAAEGIAPAKHGWTLAQVRDRLLTRCEAACARETWLHVGMALHHEFDGSAAALDLYDQWSKTGEESYAGRADVEGRWRSFGRSNGRPRTLGWLISHTGWEADPEYHLEGFDDEPTTDAEPAAAVPAVETGTSLHDLDISRRLAKQMAGRYRFEHSGRGWLHHVGGAYVPCSRGEQFEAVKMIGPAMLRAAPADPDKLAAHMKAVQRAMSRDGMAAALKLTESDPRIAARPSDFDADPDLFNAADCAVYLPTGARVEHSAAQFLSRQSPVNYDPNAKAPTWERFLRDISSKTGEPDDDWIDFLQRALGYTLSGRVNEELMFFMLGVGANGKSVLCNVIRHVFGTYAISVPAGFLMVSKRDGEAATPSLATLPGARLALANEVEAGSRVSAQTVKVATSTDPISARANYGSPFTFQPSHTLWVRGNHKPIVTDNDEGIWRRIVLVPFDRHFTADQKDTGLEAKLMAEAPGILAWLVRGHAEYRRRGIKRARRVESASLSYRKESDLTGQWIEECAEVGPSFAWVDSDAYASYRGWCVEQGLNPITKKSLTINLAERGFAKTQETRGARRRLYTGLKPASSYTDSDSASAARLFDAQDAQD